MLVAAASGDSPDRSIAPMDTPGRTRPVYWLSYQSMAAMPRMSATTSPIAKATPKRMRGRNRCSASAGSAIVSGVVVVMGATS